MIPDMNINNNKQLDDIAFNNLKLSQSADIKALRDVDDTDYRFELADKLAHQLELIEAVYMGATNGTIDTATNDDTSEESTTH